MLQTVTPTMQAQFVDFFLRKTQGSFEVCGTGLGPITPGGLSTQRLVWIWWEATSPRIGNIKLRFKSPFDKAA